MPRKPKPEPVNPDELESLALAVVRADRYPCLATIDGDQPRVRPVSPVRTDGFSVYVANLRKKLGPDLIRTRRGAGYMIP